MLVGAPRALEVQPRGVEALLAVVRDAEHQVRIAGVLQSTFRDAALDGRDHTRPVFALSVDFAEAHEQVAARRKLGGALE